MVLGERVNEAHIGDNLSSWILKSSATSKCHKLTSSNSLSKSLTWKMVLLFRELASEKSDRCSPRSVEEMCIYLLIATMSSNVVAIADAVWFVSIGESMIRFSTYESIFFLVQQTHWQPVADCHANCDRLIKSQWLMLLSAKLSEVTWCRSCLLLDHWPW